MFASETFPGCLIASPLRWGPGIRAGDMLDVNTCEAPLEPVCEGIHLECEGGVRLHRTDSGEDGEVPDNPCVGDPICPSGAMVLCVEDPGCR